MLLTITSSSDSVAKENDWLNSFRNSSIPAPVLADMLKHFIVEDISDVKSSCDEKSERVDKNEGLVFAQGNNSWGEFL